MAVTLRSTEVSQGCVLTKSLLVGVFQTFDFTGEVLLAAADQFDASLVVILSLQVCNEPGCWRSVATTEWVGGANVQPPLVLWSGVARRVRLMIEVSRPVSFGAQVSY